MNGLVEKVAPEESGRDLDLDDLRSTTLTLNVTGDLTSEDKARLRDVMLRALSEYSPANMNDNELDAVTKVYLGGTV